MKRRPIWKVALAGMVAFMALQRLLVHGAAGAVVLWGYEGSVTNVPPGLTNIVSVAAGLDHALALRADGTVVAWGDDNGYGETLVPPGLSNVVAVSAGWNFSMALRNDGTVVTWGDTFITTPPDGLTNVVAIAAGGHQFCLALRADKSVAAWGWNGYGQTNVPADLTNVVAVAGGLDHCAALRSDGTVAAWGGSDPFFGETNVPPGLSNVVAISAGWSQTLALRADGTVVGWGFDANVPPDLNHIVAVAGGWDAGQQFLKNDGTLPNNAFGWSNLVSVARGHFFTIAVTVPGDWKQALTRPLADPAWSANEFTASTQTRFGRVYALEYRNSLNSGFWSQLPLISGSGAAQTVRDQGAVEPQRFYRVLEW